MAEENRNLPVGESSDGKTKKSLKDIQVPNWVAVLLVVAFVGICTAVYFYLKPDTSQPVAGTDVQTPANSQQTDASQGDAVNVEVLPQTERNFGDGQARNPFKSEDLSGLKLTGVLTSSSGRTTAIVESDSTSYIVKVGETMKDSNWTVDSIDENSITFVNGESSKTVYMNNQ